MLLNVKTTTAFWVKIYIAGPVEVYKQICREHCFAKGDCVTFTETDYIYTGGEESGVIIEWINYARFPRTEKEIWDAASELAKQLIEAGCQSSYSIVSPKDSIYCSRRKDVFGEEA